MADLFAKYNMNELVEDIIQFFQQFIATLQEALAGIKFVPNYENSSWVEENAYEG